MTTHIDVAVASSTSPGRRSAGRAWGARALPAPVAAVLDGDPDGGPFLVDMGATIVIAHSDDEDGAGKNYKRT